MGHRIGPYAEYAQCMERAAAILEETRS